MVPPLPAHKKPFTYAKVRVRASQRNEVKQKHTNHANQIDQTSENSSITANLPPKEFYYVNS